jgi:hypothetical protein
MKQLRILSTAAAALLACAVIITACQKSAGTTSTNNTNDAETATLSASAAADDQSNNVYNGVVDNVMGVNSDAGIGTGIGVFAAHVNHVVVNNHGTGEGTDGMDSTTHCYNVTVSPVTPGLFPKTITIDFGTGCTGRDGHTRRGKIITVYTGKMKLAGSKATTTFDGFYFDSIKVEGTHIIENNSTDTNLVFTLTLQNGKLTAPSGDYVAVNRTHTWTQIAGGATHQPADDVFKVTGSSDGTVQVLGLTFQWTTDIIQPLVRKFTCPWFVSGQVKITHDTHTAILDYGNGSCDNQATLTVGTKVYNITLR